MTPSRRNGQPPKCSPPDPPDRLGDELRSWIDHVIVPILVREFLREKNLQGGESDG
jgi:hypothetical protein